MLVYLIYSKMSKAAKERKCKSKFKLNTKTLRIILEVKRSRVNLKQLTTRLV